MKLRWGLLGAGNIIHRWIKGAMQMTDELEIVAVASRTPESAQKIADLYGIPEVLTYDEMIGRKDIDIVYIPVPHPFHKDLAIRAMESGKAVLVEKPACVNAADFEELVACAKKNKVFLMEGVWTRLFPIVDTIRQYCTEDGIGKVRMIRASFAYRVPEQAVDHRLCKPELAGGGLLDVGVYNLHFADLIMDQNPVQLMGMAAMDTDEMHLQVDEQAAYLAKYEDGAMAMMASAIRTNIPDTAYIYGTKGSMEIPVFWKPTKMQVTIDGETKTIECPVPQKVEGIEDEGFQYEIAHVDQCVREGLIESPIVTWKKSGEILKQCDELRAQWGLIYSFE